MAIFIGFVIVTFIVIVLLDKRIVNRIKSSFGKINESIKNKHSIKRHNKDQQINTPKKVDTDIIPDKSKLRIENKPVPTESLEPKVNSSPITDDFDTTDVFANELDDLIKDLYFEDAKPQKSAPAPISRARKTSFDNYYEDSSEFEDISSIFETYRDSSSEFATRFRNLPKDMQILIIADVLKRKEY